MEKYIVFDRDLTPADVVVLKSLCNDIEACSSRVGSEKDGSTLLGDKALNQSSTTCLADDKLKPTVLLSTDDYSERVPGGINKLVIEPFIRWAQQAARHDSDVVMIIHLILYFSTSVPSAFLLYRNFNYAHGVGHLVMQIYYIGTYTLMMHQHIHQRGILSKKYGWLDQLFPYILDPLMGHTWNTYYYHHVKHHHVEGNGPDDLSSTMRYQRDSVGDFLRYVGRFFVLVWIDLPLYFVRKHRPGLAMRTAGWEIATYLFYYGMATRADARATLFVYILPFVVLRLGLMVGNWGQHAFVDMDDPTSDFRSSITLIDVASNRFCFNDGYHTSHHLNPLRHWRDHPNAFLEQKHTYAREGALVFHNIDFLMITYRLLRKDYGHLAKCLVPLGHQRELTLEGRAELLQRLTRKMDEKSILDQFGKGKGLGDRRKTG
ncbi:hypothetical protein CDD82_6615 [Ophiocordyceps australis]|uniref:Fatty acid desaturase domain-containing protein n=1 Tax=Ophiocordyceps australis TaxID=1399860 RepID=A0A2C5ZR61_9HYPO|nr:hypothetical protein CDD82_6615 [Ophiocordyceps australis]